MRKITFFLFLLFVSALAFGQVQIHGKILDAQNRPLEGVSLTVKGLNTTVLSDAQGNFSITANSGNILVLSYQGHTQEYRVDKNSTPVISFTEQNQQLTEVVVTALGQTKSRAKIGYAATTFNSEAINQSSPISPLDGLSGKVAGAEISKVGGPGSSEKVVLRGYGIISGGSNQPLYVIDGVPLSDSRFGSNVNLDFGNGSTDLNPNDIETITILKGTAASSLYGTLARNGAIIITTKRGKPGKIRVQYAGSANFSMVGKMPTMQDIFGEGWSSLFVLSENGSWGPKLDGKDRLWGSVVDNSQLIKPFSFVKNNIRDFYDIGKEYNNSISLSGGNENTSFYFSYGNVTSDGVIPSNIDFFERNTFALRTSSRFGNFSVNTSFNYVNKNVNAPFTGQPGSDGGLTFEALLQIPVDIPIKDFKDYKNKFFNVNNFFNPYDENPYYPLYENSNNQQSDRFFGNIDMMYRFTEHLSAQLRIGGDFTNARTFGYKAVNNPTPGSWNGGGNVEGAVRNPDFGSVTESSDYLGTINSDFILKYATNFYKNFSLDALAGYNFNQQSSKDVSARITNLVVPNFYNLSNSTNPPVASDSKVESRIMGAYAQATVGYKDQVFLTGNARNDWASSLPLSKNHFFYPGGNLSWIISRTLDLNRTPISSLKVRASYGKTGSAPQPYLVNPSLVSGSIGVNFGSLNFPFSGVNAFGISNQIAKSDLSPILTSETELGTEIRFFKNRLGVDVAVYDKRTNGQIFSVPIDPATGYTLLVENLGLVQNKGIELTVDGRLVNQKNFNWILTYTFTKNKNLVLNLNGGPNPAILNSVYNIEEDAVPGRPVTGIYSQVPQMTADGKIIVNPTNGIPLIADKKGYYGNGEYDYMMGLTNSLVYKNWALNFTLDFRKGGIMYSGTADLLMFTGNAYTTTYNDRRPFIIPNSVVQTGTDLNGKPIYAENSSFISQANYYSYYYEATNPAQASNYTLIDRSFLKLREITLAYLIPSRWTKHIAAQGISLSLYARNLILWLPTSNIFIDPEASNLGNDLTSQLGEFRTAPVSKQFGVSVKANF